MQHAIFATDNLFANTETSLPRAGIVGTTGSVNAPNTSSLTLSIPQNLIRGQFWEVRFQNIATDANIVATPGISGNTPDVFYGTVSGAGSLSGSNVDQRNPVYDPIPKFPDVRTGSPFWGTLATHTGASQGVINTAGPHSPGRFSSIATAWNVQDIQLTAGGVYYIEGDISIGSGHSITIRPDAAGSYRTIIYVGGSVSLMSPSHIRTMNAVGDSINPPSSFGQVMFIVAGSNEITINSNSQMTGTIIAPNATVNIRSNAIVRGQVLARSISLTGFDGGNSNNFVFTPIIMAGDIEISGTTFHKVQDCATAPRDITQHITVKMPPEVLNRTRYIDVDWEIVPLNTTDALAAGGVPAVISGPGAHISGATSGTLTFPIGTDPADQVRQIPINVVNDGTWDESVRVFSVKFEVDYDSFNENFDIEAPPPAVVSIKMDPAVARRTAPPAPTATATGGNLIARPQASIPHTPREVVNLGVGTFSNTHSPAITYGIVSGNDNGWFEIKGNQIWTTDDYQAGAGTITLRVGATADYKTGATDGNDCVLSGPEQEVTITVINRIVTAIAVTTQPLLTYAHGEKLDLSALRVTLTYNDATTATDVKVGELGVSTASPFENEFTLSRSTHNGQTITVSSGGVSTQTGQLVISQAAGNTVPGFVSPTLASVFGSFLSSVTQTDIFPTLAGAGYWTWSAANPAATFVGNAGTRTHAATFTPTDANFAPFVTDLTINVAKKDINSVTIGDIPAQTYTGAFLTPTPTVQDMVMVGGTNTNIISASDYTVSYENNQNASTTARFIITATDGGNYHNTKYQIFTITAADPTVTGGVVFPTGATMTFGEQLSQAVLTGENANGHGHFEFVNPNYEPTSVGAQDFDIRFVPNTSNFQTITQKVLVTVNPRPITTAQITVTAPATGVAPNLNAAVANAVPSNTFTVSDVTWTPAITGGLFLGGTQYTAAVTLTANANHTFTSGLTTATINDNNATITNNTGSAATLSWQFTTPTAERTATEIEVQNPPPLSYIHGDLLNLTALVARILYNDGTSEGDIAFADFHDSIDVRINDKSVNNATELVHLEHDDKVITLIYRSSAAVRVNTAALTVAKRNISGANIPDLPDVTYNSTAHLPVPTVSFPSLWSGSPLTHSSHFSLSYGANVNAGANAGTVKVTGIGNFEGERDLTFNILRQPINTTNLVVAAPTMNGTPITHTQVENSDNAKFSVAALSWSPTPAGNFLGSQIYTATITLEAASNYIFATGAPTFSASINTASNLATVASNDGETAVLTFAFPQTDSEYIKGIIIRTYPIKSTYCHGDPLDLTGLTADIIYSDGSSKTSLDHTALAGEGIAKTLVALTKTPSGSITHGEQLSHTLHNDRGIKLSVTVNNSLIEATATEALTVNKRTLKPTVNLTGVVGKRYDANTNITPTEPKIALETVPDGAPFFKTDNPSATANFAFVDQNVDNDKGIVATNITLEGDWGDDYVLSANSANVPSAAGVNITRAPLTLTVANVPNVTFGSPVPSSFDYTLSGFVGGENEEDLRALTLLTGTPTITTEYDPAHATNKNEGSYWIRAQVGSLWARNYEFSTFNEGTLTVVALEAGTDGNFEVEVFGAPFTYTGVAQADNIVVRWLAPPAAPVQLTRDVDFTATVSGGTNAGTTHTVTVTGIGNYRGESAPVSFTINPAPLTISGFAITRPFDGTSAVNTPLGTLIFNGLQNGETANVDATEVSATYNDRYVGNDKQITFDGSFKITGGTATPSNYIVTEPTPTGNITLYTPLAPDAPTVANVGTNVGTNSITITAPNKNAPLTLYEHLNLEYGISTTNNPTTATWHDGTTLSSLMPYTTYFIWARYKEKIFTNYTSPESYPALSVTTERRTPDIGTEIIFPTNLTAVYGDKLSEVKPDLPANGTNSIGGGTFSWVSPNTLVGDVTGSPRPFKMRFTPSDMSINAVEADVWVTVNPRSIPLARVSFMEPSLGLALSSTATKTAGENFTILAPGGVSVLWDPPHSTALEGTLYAASVTLKADVNHTFAADFFDAKFNNISLATTDIDVVNPGQQSNTVVLSHEFLTQVRNIASITITQEPRTGAALFAGDDVYTHGNALDLSRLLVKIYYDNGSEDPDLPYSELAVRGISVSVNGSAISHGGALSYTSHNGFNIELSTAGIPSPITAQSQEALVIKRASALDYPGFVDPDGNGHPNANMPPAPDPFPLTAAEATYGDLLSSVSLASGWAWNFAGDEENTKRVGNAGERLHSATFTPSDPNFAPLTRDIKVVVNKRFLSQVLDFTGVVGKVYDANTNIPDPQPTISLSGAVFGEKPTASATFAFQNKNVENDKYIAARNITLDDPWTANYTLVMFNGTTIDEIFMSAPGVNITPLPIIITPDSYQRKEVGELDPLPFTYTAAPPLFEGDNFTGALSREEGEEVGEYAFVLGTLTAGDNYALSLGADVKFRIMETGQNCPPHDYEWVDVTPATCRQDGLRRYICSICGDVSASEIIPQTGCTWDIDWDVAGLDYSTDLVWDTIAHPTCFVQGIMTTTRTCIVDGCGKVQTLMRYISLLNGDSCEENGRSGRSADYGVIFSDLPQNAGVEFTVIAPQKPISMRATILDVTGNAVLSSEELAAFSDVYPYVGRFVWDRRNAAGREVASGTYLLIVEVVDADGKRHSYSVRFGVRK